MCLWLTLTVNGSKQEISEYLAIKISLINTDTRSVGHLGLEAGKNA